MIDLLRGFALLLLFHFLGEGIHRLGLPIPGGVLGLMLFYAALEARIVRLAWVERAGGLLLRNMVLFFVPLTVGLMETGPVLRGHVVALAASLVVSTAAVLVTTGWLGQWLLDPDSRDQTPDEPGDEPATGVDL